MLNSDPQPNIINVIFSFSVCISIHFLKNVPEILKYNLTFRAGIVTAVQSFCSQRLMLIINPLVSSLALKD